MRVFFALVLCAPSVFAQGTSHSVTSACGTKDPTFDVKLDNSKHPVTPPKPGKAIIYFVQDDGSWGEHQRYVLRVGLDGTWVGAYKQNSFFMVSTEPGSIMSAQSAIDFFRGDFGSSCPFHGRSRQNLLLPHALS
jgi:hypothetical protein